DGAHPGVRTVVRAAGGTSGSGSDERSDLRAHAPSDHAGRRLLRLGHRRLASGRPAAGREPAVGVRRRRAAGGAGGQGAVLAGQAHGRFDYPRAHPRGRHERDRSRARSQRGRLLRVLRRRLLRHTDKVDIMAKGLIQTAHWRSSTLIVSETALILTAVVASAHFSMGGGQPWPMVLVDTLPKALVITSVCQLCLYYGDLYDDPHAGGSRTELFIRTLQALGITLLLLAALYTIFPVLIVERGVLAPAATLAVTALIGWRLGFAWVAKQVGPRERLLLVGTGTAAFALARELQAREEDGVQIVGFVDA